MTHATRGVRAAALPLALLAAAPWAGQAGWRFRGPWRGMPATWLAASTAPAGDGAGWVTFDPATRTLYVANNNASTISVLDAAACARRCDGPVATLPTGQTPIATAIDARTRTLFATNVDDGTVSVFDITTCNAGRTTGCGAARATVDVGGAPLGVVIDQPSDAVYVGNDRDGLAVIDGSSCNGKTTTGCGAVAHAPTGDGSAFPFVDPATRTVYVPGLAPDAATMAEVDARARTHGRAGPSPTAPVGPAGVTGGADQQTHTVYVTNADDNTVSV